VCRRGLNLLSAGLSSLASLAVSCWLVVVSVKRWLRLFPLRVQRVMLRRWLLCRPRRMSTCRLAIVRRLARPTWRLWLRVGLLLGCLIPAGFGGQVLAAPPPTTAPPPTVPPSTTALEAIAASSATTASGVEILLMLAIAGLLLLVWTLYRSIGR